MAFRFLVTQIIRTIRPPRSTATAEMLATKVGSFSHNQKRNDVLADFESIFVAGKEETPALHTFSA